MNVNELELEKIRYEFLVDYAYTIQIRLQYKLKDYSDLIKILEFMNKYFS